MENLIIHAQQYRDKLLSDPHRPTYHFAIPGGNGSPGDPNGAFYADGRYHLMYLYRNFETNAYHWGHISSADLLHWRSHPDALTVENGDQGCFSGGAFVDDDGTAYLTFWKFPARDFKGDNGGIALAAARPPYDVWERITPIAINGSREVWGTVDIERDGVLEHISCADPSNIWKKDGWYYMQTGNKCVLDQYGRAEDAPERLQGDWTDLFRSRDLRTWHFVHRFYTHEWKPGWPDRTEDDMCPSFLPLPDRKSGGRLTDKWLQLFIAHNRGAQYYVGELRDETFLPQQHGRFSWQDNTYFAPEALIDDQNRHILWAWLLDNRKDEITRFGWSGVYSFPRLVWYEDGALRMAPAQELEQLQRGEQRFDLREAADGTELPLKNGASFRLRAHINWNGAQRAGFVLRCDEQTGERTEIYVDRGEQALILDATRSGPEGRAIRESAPFALRADEALDLDIFVDQSVVEVYANERQAICRRVYPSHPERATGARTLSDGARFERVTAWEIVPTNLY